MFFSGYFPKRVGKKPATAKPSVVFASAGGAWRSSEKVFSGWPQLSEPRHLSLFPPYSLHICKILPEGGVCSTHPFWKPPPKNVQCPKKALGYKKVLALSQNGWVSVATPSPAKANALATSPGGRGVSFSIPMHVYIFKNKKEITSPPGRGRRQRRRVRAFQNRTFSNDATLCIFLMTTPLWHWQ
ncbi:MAG: hypothetical protein ACK5O1_00895 [Holosporales bacterium]